MLHSVISSAASLLVIAHTNPLLTAKAEEAGLEYFACKAVGTITFVEKPGFQSVSA